MEENNKNIDKFIKQNLKIEEPSFDFSDTVMKQIYTSDLKKDKALSSLLQKHILKNPSIDFTSKVLSIIEQNSKSTAYQPVISKKVWLFIGSAIALIFVYTLFNVESLSTQNSQVESLFSKITNSFSFTFPSITLSPLFALSIFALSSLLYIDYFIRSRKLF